MDRVRSGKHCPSPRQTGLRFLQYSLIFLPGLFAGRLCDLGYYKRTLFISRLVIQDFITRHEYKLTNSTQRDSSSGDRSHR